MKSLCQSLLANRYLGFIWGFLFVASLEAQQDWSASLFFENDLFASTDQNYTNGVKLSAVSPDIRHFETHIPAWSREVVSWLPFVNRKAPDLQRNIGISLGQAMYTPESIEAFDIVADDRPYAGWLYLAVAFHSKTKTTLDTVELQFGIVGEASGAETAQKFVHQVRDLQRPNGWHNQLEHEPGLAFIYEHKERLLEHAVGRGFGGDIIALYGVGLGNVQTYANVGAQLRWGWNIPADFGVPIIRPTGNIIAPLADSPKWGVYGFCAFEGRAVLRDIFLDGNSFTASHSVEREDFVGDAAAGISVVARDFRITYSQVFRTREFKNQQDEHTFGSLTISYFF